MTVKNVSVSTHTDTIGDVEVSTTYEYNVPDSLAEAEQLYGADAYEIFVKGFMVVIQAPARREISDLWNAIDEETRNACTTAPLEDSGQRTAILPAAQQLAVQDAMNAFRPGQKAVRGKRILVDPAKALLDKVRSGTLSPEERAQIQALLAQEFPPSNEPAVGSSSSRVRKN